MQNFVIQTVNAAERAFLMVVWSPYSKIIIIHLFRCKLVLLESLDWWCVLKLVKLKCWL